MLPTDTILTPQAFAAAEEPARRLSLRRGVGLVLFGSGFASLVYQVIWQRVLTQEIGVDAVADRRNYFVDPAGLVVVPRGGRREFLSGLEEF